MHAPNGKTHNQIDYMLSPEKFKSSINKVRTRTFPGADIGSDHDMVLMTLKLKLKTHKKYGNTRIRISLDKLKDPQVAGIFEANIGGKFAALNLLQDIDLLTDNMEKIIIETATEILGKDRKKSKPWITDDILDQCDLRRALKKTKKDDPEAARQHTSVNRNIRKMARKAKEKWITEQCESIDAGIRQGNCKAAYTTLNKLTRTQQPIATIIEDKHGSLLTEKAEITQRWTEYCQELYNCRITLDPTILANAIKPCSECEDAPILQAEVEEAVKSLKIGKSPGIDNILAELWKHYNSIDTHMPKDIGYQAVASKMDTIHFQSLIIPIPKKGNSRQCQNYRTISLICHASKVMLRIILNRLRNRAEEILSEEQAGFRPKRSTTEQIFNLRLLIEKHLQHQHDLYHNFIDFKKAFDRVWHEGLWQVLRHYNYTGHPSTVHRLKQCSFH